MYTGSQQDLKYEYAVCRPDLLNDGLPRIGRLPAAIEKAASGDDQSLEHLLTLTMAQQERATWLGGEEKRLLDDSILECRRVLSPYIGSTVIARVARGGGSIADVSSLLNEMGPLHSRGPSLIDRTQQGWRQTSSDIGKVLNEQAKWEFRHDKPADAPALVELALLDRFSKKVPPDLRVLRLQRVLKALDGNWAGTVPNRVRKVVPDLQQILKRETARLRAKPVKESEPDGPGFIMGQLKGLTRFLGGPTGSGWL